MTATSLVLASTCLVDDHLAPCPGDGVYIEDGHYHTEVGHDHHVHEAPVGAQGPDPLTYVIVLLSVLAATLLFFLARKGTRS